MEPDEHILYYAAHPEAHRTTVVDPKRSDGTLDRIAAAVWAQRDYDERQLAALRAGGSAKPCRGSSFEDRVLARGAVEAVLAELRNLDPEGVERLLHAPEEFA